MTTRRILSATAIGLALAALVVGGRGESSAPGDPGVHELRTELASGAATMDAVTLGEWIRDRGPARILDVQDSSAHVRFSIPTARHVSYRGLMRVERSGTPIVVYDDGSGQASRAWLLLRRLGHPEVYVLERGVAGWVEGVLEPVLPAGTEAERARYDRVAAVSRYFGGMPRVGPPRSSPRQDADAAVQLLSRRGCY